MNDPLRSELERLKERQAQLYHAVDLLGVHVKALEKRVEEREEIAGQNVAVPLAVPPVLPMAQQAIVARAAVAEPTPGPSKEGKPEIENIAQPIATAQSLTQPLTPAQGLPKPASSLSPENSLSLRDQRSPSEGERVAWHSVRGSVIW